MTALIDTLFQLEKYLGLELDSLLPYAEMDDLGGFHPDPSQAKWDVGAVWDVEGRTIYALIRALKPLTVVEIGSGKGCSTNHIASALKENDIEQFEHVGHVVTLDRGNTPAIDERWGSYVTVLPGDAFDYLEAQPDNSIDFILEDADHSEAMCYRVGELAKTKLRPGGVLMAHDAVHPTVGRDVRAGYDRAGLDVRTYRTDPSDCGWGVWRKPDVARGKGIGHIIERNNLDVIGEQLTRIYAPEPETDYSPLDDEPVLQAQEDKPPAKAKRTRKAKK